MTTASAKPTKFGSRPLIARCLRLTLMTIIVAALCAVSYNVGRLWRTWRHTGKSHVESHTTNDLESMMGALTPEGQWQFGDANWGLRSQTIQANELASRLEATATADGGKSTAELRDLGNELIDLAHKLHVTPTRRGDNDVYQLDRPDLKVQLVVRHFGRRPKAIALAAAFPKGAGDWQLFAFTPQTNNGSATPDAAHLLPLPSAAKRSGGRFTDDGQLLLELISLDADTDSLLSMWKHNGWEVRKSEFSGPDDFSYLCARGNEVIYAWSAGSRDSVRNLMLVRSPANSDIQAKANTSE
jgi:hypothetical protein